MMSFTITKRSRRSSARLGILRTSHGVIETPSLIPVATQATVKTLSNDDVRATGTQALICNTFHLHLKPGESIVRAHGGLHSFMQWNRPLMTDSGGFQVFSLGFGIDTHTGKIAAHRQRKTIRSGTQPSRVTITDRGAHFRSPLDGSRLFLGPRESIAIQQKLGADIMFAFDECPPPSADASYIKASLVRTHRWAETCLAEKTSRQALFGIVQGGSYKQLRLMSARTIGAMPFDGFGIGGEFGSDKKMMATMITWVAATLPEEKPRHLLGIGHPEDLRAIVRAGVDTFDCIAPTHYARHGTAFVPSGRLDLMKSSLLRDRKPIDPRCGCPVCSTYSRGYLAHLFRAKELSAMRLVSIHNLFYMNAEVAHLRTAIRRGQL